MARVWKDRVLDTTTTTGTGTLTLAGAVTGFAAAGAVGNANSAYWVVYAVDAGGNPTGAWEVFDGTYTTSGTTLTRAVVLDSSNSGLAVSFAAGTKRVALVNPAGRSLVASGLPVYGSVLFATTDGVVASDPAQLYYSDATGRMGLLTAAPTHALTLALTAALTGVALYGSASQTTNYTRVAFNFDNGNVRFVLQTEQGGTGTAMPLVVGTTGAVPLTFVTNNTPRWAVNASGHLVASTDASYDIGQSGATRPRHGYFSGTLTLGSGVTLADTGGTTAGGLTFGTDVNLYRTGANAVRLLTTDAGTSNTVSLLTLARNSSGTPLAAFGTAITFKLETSTTNDVDAALLRAYWSSPTNGASAGGLQLQGCYAGSALVGVDVVGTAAGATIGFLGATPVVRQTGDVATAMTTFGLMSGTPTVPWHPSYLAGMTLSNNVSLPNTTIDVALGWCRDDANTSNITLAAQSKLLNASGSWTAGTGNNGLDTGARANSTWYHVFVVAKALGANPDVLFSLSPSAPTMPATYTLKRRIGAIKTDGSGNILAFVQRGNQFLWGTPVADVSASNPGTAAVTRTLASVPTGVRVEALLTVGFSAGTQAENPAYIYVSDLAVADAAPNQSGALTFSSYSGTAVINNSGAQARVFTNTSAQVRTRILLSSTNTVLAINTNGWADDLAGASGATGATGAAGPAGSAAIDNPIDNNNFDVWQRGTSFATVATGTLTADRWHYGKAGSTAVHTVSRDTSVPTVAASGLLSLYSLKLAVTTADASIAAGDLVYVSQAIEGPTFLAIAQRAFTLSFWVNATVTGVYCVSFRNSGQDRSYVAEYTVNVTNTWEYKTVTVPASPSGGTWSYAAAGVGLRVAFAQACGSTFQTTANAWQTGNFFGTASQVNNLSSTSNTFFLSQINIALGGTAYALAPVPYADALARCQRFAIAIAGHPVGVAQGSGSGYSRCSLSYPVTMASNPTIGPTPAAAFSVNSGAAGTVGPETLAMTGASFNNTSNNWTTNAIVTISVLLTADIV